MFNVDVWVDCPNEESPSIALGLSDLDAYKVNVKQSSRTGPSRTRISFQFDNKPDT